MEDKIYQVLRKHRLPLKKREELMPDLLALFSVVVPKGTLTMCHARTGKECIKPTSCQAFGCNKQM